MANTSRSPKPLKKGKNQPNTKVRKLRKRIKKSKHNFQKKTTSNNPNKRISTNSNRRQKIKKHNNLAASIFAMTILLLSAGVAIAISWISALFIFNPLSISWLNPFLPKWAKITFNSEEQPHTLKQIQAQIKKQKRISGKIFPLETDTDNSFLLPIYRISRKNCNSGCKYIVELRTYQLATDFEWRSRREKHYYLTNKFPVTGPEEFEVIAPLVDANIEESAGSSIALPVTEIGPFGL